MKTYETSGTILFEEQQKYPRWIGRLVTFWMIVTIVTLVVDLITEKDKSQPLLAMLVFVPITALVVYLNRAIRLEKVVTSNGLYYRWMPWQKRYRVIEKEDIASFTIRKFPLLSYGFGWFPTYGRYHNLSRGEGLQLYLKDGRKFFFSTANKD